MKLLAFIALALLTSLASAGTVTVTIPTYTDTVNVPFVAANYTETAVCGFDVTTLNPSGTVPLPATKIVYPAQLAVGQNIVCALKVHHIPTNTDSALGPTTSYTITAGNITVPTAATAPVSMTYTSP